MLSRIQLEPLVRSALLEDLGQGDVTTKALAPMMPKEPKKGLIRVRKPCVVSGLIIAELTFQLLDQSIRFDAQVRDGDQVEAGAILATVTGPFPFLLEGERTALNFLQHLSGIATQTRRYVEAIQGTPCHITHTRKTLPGLRLLERQAVIDGGGSLHRYNLSHAAMVKDNHLQAIGMHMAEAVQRLRAMLPHTARLEVEADTLETAIIAAKEGADVIMLDNMTPEQVRDAMKHLPERVIVEVSGGITLENARAYAEAGAHVLSTSQITLSAPAIDIGLDFE
jgi:nicotinate-nucleotide pyrophosphorylase (carboxylating)